VLYHSPKIDPGRAVSAVDARAAFERSLAAGKRGKGVLRVADDEIDVPGPDLVTTTSGFGGGLADFQGSRADPNLERPR
jgi:hypothetical protein